MLAYIADSEKRLEEVKNPSNSQEYIRVHGLWLLKAHFLLRMVDSPEGGRYQCGNSMVAIIGGNLIQGGAIFVIKSSSAYFSEDYTKLPEFILETGYTRGEASDIILEEYSQVFENPTKQIAEVRG